MTHHEANRILDRAREGQQFSEFVITRALELTGDLKDCESREWIRRYRKKMLEEGRGEAQYWWQQTLTDIAKKRGQQAADDLRQRMNKIKQESLK